MSHYFDFQITGNNQTNVILSALLKLFNIYMNKYKLQGFIFLKELNSI